MLLCCVWKPHVFGSALAALLCVQRMRALCCWRLASRDLSHFPCQVATLWAHPHSCCVMTASSGEALLYVHIPQRRTVANDVSRASCKVPVMMCPYALPTTTEGHACILQLPHVLTELLTLCTVRTVKQTHLKPSPLRAHSNLIAHPPDMPQTLTVTRVARKATLQEIAHTQMS
jgi:hypothetical protein